MRENQQKIDEKLNNYPLQKLASNSQVLSCFEIYKNFEILNSSDLKFKKNYKYTIVHPYYYEYPPLTIDKIPKIEVILKMCTLYKEKPYGLAHIYYKDPNS